MILKNPFIYCTLTSLSFDGNERDDSDNHQDDVCLAADADVDDDDDEDENDEDENYEDEHNKDDKDEDDDDEDDEDD